MQAVIMLRGKLVILNACMRKEKGLKINYLTFHPRKLMGKKNKLNPK